MARVRLQRSEAVVIKHSDFGEADKLLTLYTPFLGKVKAIAKGVRRTTSRLGGHVELFNHAHVLLAKGRNLDIVTQAETMHAFIALRSDLRRTGYACYVAELLDRLTVEQVENQPVFALLIDTLERLDGDRSPEMAVRYYEMQLLGFLGYRPQLFRCVGCGEELGPKANFYSAAAGGTFCPQCAHGQPMARMLTLQCFKVLRLLQAGDQSTASRLRLNDLLREELEAVLRGQITYVLEGELRSLAVMRSLAPNS